MSYKIHVSGDVPDRTMPVPHPVPITEMIDLLTEIGWRETTFPAGSPVRTFRNATRPGRLVTITED